MPNYRISLNLSKLDESAFFQGKNGTYVNLTMWENDGEDQYGNSHSLKQDMGKDRKGEKTPYIGNAKTFGSQSSPRQQSQPNQQANGKQWSEDPNDDIPF